MANIRVDPFRLAWVIRSDVRKGAPAGCDIPAWFQVWWAVDGQRSYPIWNSGDKNAIANILEPSSKYSSAGEFGISRLLEYLLDTRSDLRNAFDPNTEAGRWAAIAWQYAYGLAEQGLVEKVSADIVERLDNSPGFLLRSELSGTQFGGITWLMLFVWRSVEEAREAFDLGTEKGQKDFIHWFFMEGVAKLGVGGLVAPRWREWLKEPVALRKFPTVRLMRAVLMFWAYRAEYWKKMDIESVAGVKELVRRSPDILDSEPNLNWLADKPKSPTRVGPFVDNDAWSRFGVNLIGYAFGELGIGEDVRMAAAACTAAGIPFTVINIDPGSNLRQGDNLLAGYVSSGMDRAPYACNVFCLTGFDTARVYLEKGLPLFEGRYNIGWWPWELPVWPKDWQQVFDLVDELWAATNFTYQAYSHAAAHKVLTLMPLAVCTKRLKGVTRRKLGLPTKRFLFLYVFDFNSYLARKNPFATVEAFRKAFPKEDGTVGLVIKTMNSKRDNRLWRRFLRECGEDPRIIVLEETLERGEVLGLIDVCDGYVSLHRSEGFGRTLAEAMLFGKPVVATGFSGNVDFLTSDTGFLVEWKRRAVRRKEYPFVSREDGAWWAEPDLDDAARQLRAARSIGHNKEFSERIHAYAVKQFSPERIGAMMKDRLQRIISRTEHALQR